MLIFTAPVFLLSCSGGDRIIRNTIDDKGMHFFRRGSPISYRDTSWGRIFIEPLDCRSWKHISGAKSYTASHANRRSFRLPPLAFFQLIISNSSSSAVTIPSIHLIQNDLFTAPIPDRQIPEFFHSPAYQSLDFHKLFAYRKLTSLRRSVRDIDYDTETEEYKEEEVNPGITALRIITFECPPSKLKDFIIRIDVEWNGGKKSIDFNLRKEEYRQSEGFMIKRNAGKLNDN